MAVKVPTEIEGRVCVFVCVWGLAQAVCCVVVEVWVGVSGTRPRLLERSGDRVSLLLAHISEKRPLNKRKTKTTPVCHHSALYSQQTSFWTAAAVWYQLALPPSLGPG